MLGGSHAGTNQMDLIKVGTGQLFFPIYPYEWICTRLPRFPSWPVYGGWKYTQTCIRVHPYKAASIVLECRRIFHLHVVVVNNRFTAMFNCCSRRKKKRASVLSLNQVSVQVTLQWPDVKIVAATGQQLLSLTTWFFLMTMWQVSQVWYLPQIRIA